MLKEELKERFYGVKIAKYLTLEEKNTIIADLERFYDFGGLDSIRRIEAFFDYDELYEGIDRLFIWSDTLKGDRYYRNLQSLIFKRIEYFRQHRFEPFSSSFLVDLTRYGTPVFVPDFIAIEDGYCYAIIGSNLFCTSNYKILDGGSTRKYKKDDVVKYVGYDKCIRIGKVIDGYSRYDKDSEQVFHRYGIKEKFHRYAEIETLESDIIEKIEFADTDFQIGDIIEFRNGIIKEVSRRNLNYFPIQYIFSDESTNFALSAKVYRGQWYKCSCCNKLEKTLENGFALDGRFYCLSCKALYIRACNDCGTLYDTRRSSNGICRRCYLSRTVECRRCGHRAMPDEMMHHEGYYFCDYDCFRRWISGDRLHRYSYKPDPTFFGEGKGFYGLELEVDKGDIKGVVPLSEISEIYLKPDGSLSDKGIEIVTQPCTLDYHRNSFPWRKLLGILAKYEYVAHTTETCGFHVHASRSLFGDTSIEQGYTIAKVFAFFDKYWRQMELIARRTETHWAKKPNITWHNSLCDNDLPGIYKGYIESKDRYQAINTKNSATIEFRLFRGTTRKSTIIATIEILDCIIMLCKELSIKELLESNWTQFVEKLQVNLYKEAIYYLKKREVM